MEPQVDQLDGVADAVRLGEQDALLTPGGHTDARDREAESQRVGHMVGWSGDFSM